MCFDSKWSNRYIDFTVMSVINLIVLIHFINILLLTINRTTTFLNNNSAGNTVILS